MRIAYCVAIVLGWYLASLLLVGCSNEPPPISSDLLMQIATQLPDDATLLLPTDASNAALPVVDLSQTDEPTLRTLLQEVISLYLLFDPDTAGLYGETAVSNITWVRNHSELVELTRYEDGSILYWVVVTQGRTFNTHPLREAPGG